ncbi:jg15786 [Pararge aegeria aegeria]|uniref:Jg15786 protein n=1 Tax=Pararge aegeria aegeria TaxID=348720 RepID=A0A8S4RJ62_9NEOP|nr:jg15786 [Pararge aegeria aegeria]
MGRAQLGKLMDVEVPRCRNGDPAPVNAALVEVDNRYQKIRWELPETNGPGPWIFKNLCPAVDVNPSEW